MAGSPPTPGYPVHLGFPGGPPYAPPLHPAIPFLASTGDRIGAFLVDAVVLLLLTIPVYVLMFMIFFGFAVEEAPFVAVPLVMFPSMLLPLLIQVAYVAMTEGRTG